MFRQFKYGSNSNKNIPENKADCYDHQVLTAGLMKIPSVGWVVRCIIDRRFGGDYYLSSDSMQTGYSMKSDMLVTAYQWTRHQIPEDFSLLLATNTFRSLKLQ
jgi:hypothetical protein